MTKIKCLSCVEWGESDDLFKMANGGHLEFSNLRILGAAASTEFTLHVHVACQIRCKSDVPFRSYSCFCEFQDGGRRPS